jgi:hypothetical protein
MGGKQEKPEDIALKLRQVEVRVKREESLVSWQTE